MLNSWGATKGCPDGLFMVNMDMNYSGTYSWLGNAHYWMTLDADFARTSSPEITKEQRLADAKAEATKKIEDAKAEIDEAKANIDKAKKERQPPY